MKNIIADNAQKLSLLQCAFAAHINKAIKRFEVVDRIATNTMGFVHFRVLTSSIKVIGFEVMTDQDDKLAFHYDPVMDQLLIDECGIAIEFSAMQAFLEEIEAFIRKVIATIE